MSDEAVIWTLVKDGHRAEALIVPAGSFGSELQYRYDGDWFYTHTYREGQGAQLLADAEAKRKELEANGWSR